LTSAINILFCQLEKILHFSTVGTHLMTYITHGIEILKTII
jgi:hypothetical protein